MSDFEYERSKRMAVPKKLGLKQRLANAEKEIMRLENALADANRKRGEAFIEAYFQTRYKEIQAQKQERNPYVPANSLSGKLY